MTWTNIQIGIMVDKHNYFIWQMISASFFNSLLNRYVLKSDTYSKKWNYHRNPRMSKPEVMLILIMFHASGYRCLKRYYVEYACVHLQHLFPNTISYNRVCRDGKGYCPAYDNLH